jgi:DNA-binding NtrC family response regulator
VSDVAIETKRFRLLIVDDEKNIRFSLSEHFKPGYAAVFTAANGADCLGLLDRERIDLVLLDQKLKESGEDGVELLGRIKERYPRVVVIIMTAFGEFEQAVRAARLGVYQYLSKPLDLDQLDLVVRNALASAQLEREVARLREIQQQRHRVEYVGGQNPTMRACLDLTKKVAESASSTVLISGETGVGKELIARMVHNQSPRADGPFVDVNCSAIHENLLESELFGHERGAFTDARRTKPGLFEMADGGSLFLDEIGEMSPSVQAKLLRVLENRRFRRVGGTEDHEVDVRVIAATNRELYGMVESGHFRKDLYYRISVIPIGVPALRERPEDIPALVKHFIDGFNAEFRRKVARVAPEAMDVLVAYRWPGNVRELRNVLERIMLTIETDVIALGDLPASLAGGGAVAVPAPGAESDSARAPDLFRPGYVATLAELEQWGIRRAMEVTGQNKTRAAELLGISRQTLRVKLKEGDGVVDGDAEGVAPPV